MQSSSVYIFNRADQLGYIRKAPGEEREREAGAESRGYIYSSQMLWSNRRASRIHWIELKTKQEGKENTGRIIRFHYMFNKIEKQNLEGTLYQLWKTYQEKPADNMHANAYVCLSSA